MRVRVKFAKYGPMKFIGHLELMRYLQSAVRRTEIPVKYDEGMHQRMVMSFAMPLGVGPISSAEYMDIELEAPISTEKAMQQLGEHNNPEGCHQHRRICIRKLLQPEEHTC